MIRLNTQLILVVSTAAILVACAERISTVATNPCAGNASVECLRKNFKDMYINDNATFWEILNSAAKNLQHCESLDKVSEFLSLVTIGNENAEYYEFVSYNLENKFTEDPKCVLSVLSGSSKDLQVRVIKRLKTPIFAENSDIERIFGFMRNDKNFSGLAQIYFAP